MTERRYLACVLNTRPDLEGNQFSLETLTEVARKSSGPVPFSIGFLPTKIGSAFNFRVVSGELLCDIESSWLSGREQEDLVPVVGYVMRVGGQPDEPLVSRISHIFEVSMTRNPITLGTWIRQADEQA